MTERAWVILAAALLAVAGHRKGVPLPVTVFGDRFVECLHGD